MKKELHDILLKFDCPEWDYPLDFDLDASMSGVREVKPLLEAVLKKPLSLDPNVQDASFFTALEVLEPVPGKSKEYYQRVAISIRFSTFGRMATVCIWDQGPDEVPVTALADLLSLHGFIYVPEEALQEEYDGVALIAQPRVTWFQRFFDY